MEGEGNRYVWWAKGGSTYKISAINLDGGNLSGDHFPIDGAQGFTQFSTVL